MVIDRIMDNANPDATSEDPAFCILSFIKFLQGLHKLRVPCVEKLENSFIELTIEMYEKMLIEHDQRFEKIPNFLSDAIKDYLSPQSRLLSSIFFGVLTIWAHALANKIPSASIIESTEALRCVRQLNDEIVDVYDDILNGLFTLPWLYALEERSDLREKVNKLWADTKNHDAFMECERILKDTSGMERAASKSLEILSKSMTITMESFKPEEAFDISIIHNIRWALINSLEQLEFNRESRIVREPCLPQDTILNIKKPLEPIPGGGVLVFRDSNSVLMTLVLKRGMLRWELPAGVCKENESLEETAQRETLEETGKHVEIGDFVAVCWHYSRNLGKGWMGMIYQARVSIIDSIDDFMVISPEAFAHSKFSIKGNPELYQAIEISKCDFDELNRLCETQLLNSTAHESVVASGFVDWTKIPTGRIHPLHRKLIEAYRIGEKNLGFLISDADDDFKSYDGKSKLYYKN
jgi:8-oxo-dGTP pyrophosphatase MutT (NUDIX family)